MLSRSYRESYDRLSLGVKGPQPIIICIAFYYDVLEQTATKSLVWFAGGELALGLMMLLTLKTLFYPWNP